MKRAIALIAALALLSVANAARAGEPWLAAGDVQLRHDLQLLVDEGLLDLPISAWRDRSLGPRERTLGRRRGPRTRVVRLAVGGAGATARRGARGSAGPRAAPAWRRAARPAAHLCRRASRGGRVRVVGQRLRGRTLGRSPADRHRRRPRRRRRVPARRQRLAGKFGNWVVTAGALDRWSGSGWKEACNCRAMPGRCRRFRWTVRFRRPRDQVVELDRGRGG